MTVTYLPSPFDFVKESKRLRFLNALFGHRLYDRHDATQRRLKWLQKIRDYAEDGMILVVEGGRDCDGVEYAGHCALVTATKEAVEAHIDHCLEWADGPMYHSLARPSSRKDITRTSRDRTMEAFEDGHAHRIQSIYA